MLLRNEEVCEEVANRLNLPYEQVRIVMLDLFHQILMCLENPEGLFLEGIMVPNSCKFMFNPKAFAEDYVRGLKRGKETDRFRKMHNHHLILLKHNEYTKEQKEFIKTNQESYSDTFQVIDSPNHPYTEFIYPNSGRSFHTD